MSHFFFISFNHISKIQAILSINLTLKKFGLNFVINVNTQFITSSWLGITLNRWDWLHSFQLSFLFIIVFFDFFKNYFGCFNAIHYWHVYVHENKFISSKITTAWRVKLFVEHLNSFSTIKAFINILIIVFFKKCLDWNHIKWHVINN